VDYAPFLTALNTTAPPSPPTSVAAQTATTSIAFSWDANPESDITGYKLHYDTDAAGYPYANVIDVSNVTSYTLASLNTGTTYYAAISAYGGGGDESWVSSTLSASIAAAPVATPTPTPAPTPTPTPSSTSTPSVPALPGWGMIALAVTLLLLTVHQARRSVIGRSE